jgi:hypothetical protein
LYDSRLQSHFTRKLASTKKAKKAKKEKEKRTKKHTWCAAARLSPTEYALRANASRSRLFVGVWSCAKAWACDGASPWDLIEWNE